VEAAGGVSFTCGIDGGLIDTRTASTLARATKSASTAGSSAMFRLVRGGGGTGSSEPCREAVSRWEINMVGSGGAVVRVTALGHPSAEESQREEPESGS
jgi:hypothetical protein